MTLDFDPNEYDSADTPEPVPPGIYSVTVARIDAKPAFVEYDNRRNYTIALEIIEGEYAGRLLKETLTLYNGKSEEHIARCRSRLKNLMWACYLPQISGVEDLQGRPCTVRVWINEGYDRDGNKRWQRRNDFNYIIPNDFERPGAKFKPKAAANGAAPPEEKQTAAPSEDPRPNDDIPF
jgi:hypothetical protein